MLLEAKLQALVQEKDRLKSYNQELERKNLDSELNASKIDEMQRQLDEIRREKELIVE